MTVCIHHLRLTVHGPDGHNRRWLEGRCQFCPFRQNYCLEYIEELASMLMVSLFGDVTWSEPLKSWLEEI